MDDRTEALRAAVWKEISRVEDPDIGLALTELGLIYDVIIEGSSVDIKMTLTSMACPLGPTLMDEIRRAAHRADGVEHVDVEIVWTPPWDPREMASEEARDILGIF